MRLERWRGATSWGPCMMCYGPVTHPVGSLCQGFTQRSNMVIWRQNSQGKNSAAACCFSLPLCTSMKEKLLKEGLEGAWSFRGRTFPHEHWIERWEIPRLSEELWSYQWLMIKMPKMGQWGDSKPEEAAHIFSEYSAEHGSCVTGYLVHCLRKQKQLIIMVMIKDKGKNWK